MKKKTNKTNLFKRLRRICGALNKLESNTERFQKLLDAAELPAYESKNGIRFRLDFVPSILNPGSIIVLRAEINGVPYKRIRNLTAQEMHPSAWNDIIPDMIYQIVCECYVKNVQLGEIPRCQECI